MTKREEKFECGSVAQGEAELFEKHRSKCNFTETFVVKATKVYFDLHPAGATKKKNIQSIYYHISIFRFLF